MRGHTRNVHRNIYSIALGTELWRVIRCFAVPAGLVLLLFSMAAEPTFSQSYPLKVDPSGRFLTDNQGTPFLVNGDAAYSMVAQLSFSQDSAYLADRAARGFNAIIASLIEHRFADSAPNNYRNIPPFSGETFTTPNEAYFALADSMIDQAEALGLCVFLYPLYLGSDPTQGWQNEVSSAPYSAMGTWGQFVGNRYKNKPNIVWVIGGDTDPSLWRGKVDSFVSALKAADNVYPNRPITALARRGGVASTYFPEAWLSLNDIYISISNLVPYADSSRFLVPPRPSLLLEGDYENDHNGVGAQGCRQQAYEAVLRGQCGNFFGNCPIWSSGSSADPDCVYTDWTTAWSSPGSQSMTFFKNLFALRSWYLLTPDTGSAVLTAGQSSGTDLAVCAQASDSSCIIAYLPSSRAVTINPSGILGSQVHVQWYDPSSGLYSEVGTFDKSIRSFTPPLSGDWVLVMDAVATIPPPPVPNSPVNGSSGVASDPSLTWKVSSGAASYEIQVATDSLFTNIMADRPQIVGNSCTVTNLNANSIYYWRVDASNAAGTSPYSGAWEFRTHAGCCISMRGNVNAVGIIDLGDLSALISYLTGNGYTLPCQDAANVNGAGIIDLGDLSALVSYLVGAKSSLPNCP